MNILFRYFTVCAVFVGPVWFQFALAQTVDPKQYYEKDYAVAPNYRPEGSQAIGTHTVGKSEAQQNQGKFSSMAGGNGTPIPTESLVHALPQDLSNINLRKTRLIVVVNSLEAAHFKEVVKKTVEVANSGLMPVVSVMHIGNVANVAPEIQSQLNALGIGVVSLTVPPYKLNITTSPTWIFETLQGRYVVEGSMYPERFISQSGEYLPPSAGSRPAPLPAGQNPHSTQKAEIK